MADAVFIADAEPLEYSLAFTAGDSTLACEIDVHGTRLGFAEVPDDGSLKAIDAARKAARLSAAAILFATAEKLVKDAR